MRWLRCLVSTDHKVVARLFLFSGLAFLLLGGLLAMVMRWQWAHPGTPVPLVGQLLFGETGGARSAQRLRLSLASPSGYA